ncbi:unnamed protein product, partial [Rotaria socialis]
MGRWDRTTLKTFSSDPIPCNSNYKVASNGTNVMGLSHPTWSSGANTMLLRRSITMDPILEAESGITMSTSYKYVN